MSHALNAAPHGRRIHDGNVVPALEYLFRFLTYFSQRINNAVAGGMT